MGESKVKDDEVKLQYTDMNFVATRKPNILRLRSEAWNDSHEEEDDVQSFL